MRVLAARFPDQASARLAQSQLMTVFDLRTSDIGVELLANGHAEVAILAGRFPEGTVPAARGLVEGLGGTLVADVDAAEQNA